MLVEEEEEDDDDGGGAASFGFFFYSLTRFERVMVGMHDTMHPGYVIKL